MHFFNRRLITYRTANTDLTDITRRRCTDYNARWRAMRVVLQIHSGTRAARYMELLWFHKYRLPDETSAMKTGNPLHCSFRSWFLSFAQGFAFAHNSALLYVDSLVYRYFTTVLSFVTMHSSIHTAHLTLVPPLFCLTSSCLCSIPYQSSNYWL